MTAKDTHPGDSSIQRGAESVIRAALEKELGVALTARFPSRALKLDGYAEGRPPTCVEIWAHQGPAKSAQRAKVMKDMCKLLLCDRLLGRQCRKVLAVSDEAALAFLQNSWQGRFANEFGIELQVVEIPPDVRERIREAQKRQYR